MTQQNSSSIAARVDDVPPPDGCEDVAVRLRAAGRRGAATALIGAALASYWRLVAVTDASQRRALLQVLRQDVATGHTTVRACVPVALGEPDFSMALAATRAYVGAWPASIDRRAQVVDEVLDWIVRGLALEPAALVCALLDGADEACLERLARVRSRLDARATAAVFTAFRGVEVADGVANFLADWRATVDCAGSVAA